MNRPLGTDTNMSEPNHRLDDALEAWQNMRALSNKIGCEVLKIRFRNVRESLEPRLEAFEPPQEVTAIRQTTTESRKPTSQKEGQENLEESSLEESSSTGTEIHDQNCSFSSSPAASSHCHAPASGHRASIRATRSSVSMMGRPGAQEHVIQQGNWRVEAPQGLSHDLHRAKFQRLAQSHFLLQALVGSFEKEIAAAIDDRKREEENEKDAENQECTMQQLETEFTESFTKQGCLSCDTETQRMTSDPDQQDSSLKDSNFGGKRRREEI